MPAARPPMDSFEELKAALHKAIVDSGARIVSNEAVYYRDGEKPVVLNFINPKSNGEARR